MTYPRLDDVVKADDVSKKGGGNFAADYVNWARIAAYLREHAPGWQPCAKPAADGGIVHRAPDGSCYLLIGFEYGLAVNLEDEACETQYIPHAVMDHRMNAKQQPDARDISDAFVRGMCKAAALLFGLGWKLWSKDDPMEREAPAPKPKTAVEAFPLKEHALSALENVKTPAQFKSWGARVKASQIVGDDLSELRDAGQEHMAKIKEASA
tara:strand:+ start:730 stop:1359 length:630 start_codon:yes stop_codon:yes gene_type:complete